MHNALPRRQRIRLGRETYAMTGSICSATICTNRRARIFAEESVARAAIEVLLTRANKLDVPIYAFCVMPDHVHLVIGPSTRCDIVTFVAQFKNLAQRAAWGLGVRGRIWQTSFWDHFLRREEQVEDVVQYVLNNPVRAGLASAWRDYPFCGSLVFELCSED